MGSHSLPLGRGAAAGTSGPHREPLIEAVQMVPVEALHDPQGVAELEILETDRALLAPVEEVVSCAPLHGRNAGDLLQRQPLRPRSFGEEGTLIGLLHAGLVVYVRPAMPLLTVRTLLLECVLLLDLVLNPRVLLGRVLLAVPVVDLAAL